MIIAGEIVIGIGFVFILFGVIGQIRYRTFYKKLLVASIIDSAGVIAVFVGVMIRQGFTSFSLKVLILLILLLLINPLASHKLGRSAYLSRMGDKG